LTLKRVIDCDSNNEKNRQSSIKIEKCYDFYSKNLRDERIFLSLRSKLLIMIAICDVKFAKRVLKFDNVTVRIQNVYIYAIFFLSSFKNFFFLIIFSDLWFIFLFFSKRSIISLFQMTDLTVFLNEKFDVKMNIIIEKLRRCSFEEKYRAQIIILNRIIQTSIILDEKAKTFWQYVLNDFDNWRFHHSIVLNFVAIYSVISKIMNVVKKRKNAY
jgi:hypothetical protein